MSRILNQENGEWSGNADPKTVIDAEELYKFWTHDIGTSD